LFASEMKALLEFDIPRNINFTSVYQYFQLNYIPSPESIFNGIKKLPQGNYLLIDNGKVTTGSYYKIPYKNEYS